MRGVAYGDVMPDHLVTPTDGRPSYRAKFIDFDGRRDPKTDVWCCVCQKDLKPGQPRRAVHLVEGGAFALHPEDEAIYVPDGGDMGAFPIGSDCGRRLGLEWTHPAGVFGLEEPA